MATRPDQRGRVCVAARRGPSHRGGGVWAGDLVAAHAALVARGLSGQESGGPARRRAVHAFVALMEPAQRVDGISFTVHPLRWLH